MAELPKVFFNKMQKFPKIYCEIGLNHMGNKQYLKEYLKVLSQPNINGITLQLLKKSFYKNNPQYESFKINKKTIVSFLISAKKYKKEIGFVTNDYPVARLFRNKIDFIKVLSQDMSNISLLKKLYNLKLPLYLSVGFSSSNQINTTLKQLKAKHAKSVTLLHTSFDKKINKLFNKSTKEDFSLKRINNLKKKFDLQVGFTNHYKNLNKIIKSVKFNPDAIFFYVKLNKNLDYPDKDWAVNIANVKKLTKQIIKIKK